MLTIGRKLAKNYINARGWRTKHKFLLIESDDWGSIRMPDKKTYEYFLSNNIQVDKNYFDRNDSLESADDLNALFEVLSSVKDINGNPAILTAFTVMANPDFDRIAASDKKEYHYEVFTKTYEKNTHTAKSFRFFQEGILNKLIYPQFHGREHLHVLRYIEAINSSSQKEILAYDHQAFIGSQKTDDVFHYPLGYMAAFNWSDVSETDYQKEIIMDGLKIFKQLFGFESTSFVASQSIWSDEINSVLYENGVRLMVGQQLYPIGNNKTKIINKTWGKKNKLGQIYWRRNCTFEPSRNQNYDWVKRTLKEIEIAFRWGKPAVINSHRVNYIGSIFPENRDQSLKKLKTLLKEVQKHWPDVEFIDTERLGRIMMKSVKAV